MPLASSIACFPHCTHCWLSTLPIWRAQLVDLQSWCAESDIGRACMMPISLVLPSASNPRAQPEICQWSAIPEWLASWVWQARCARARSRSTGAVQARAHAHAKLAYHQPAIPQIRALAALATSRPGFGYARGLITGPASPWLRPPPPREHCPASSQLATGRPNPLAEPSILERVGRHCFSPAASPPLNAATN